MISILLGDYVRTILYKHNMEDCNHPVSTPGPEIFINQPEDKLLKGARIKEYQAFIEALQYLAQISRYDICYAANQLSRVCHKPSIIHMGAAKRVLRYLKGCPDTTIVCRKGKSELV